MTREVDGGVDPRERGGGADAGPTTVPKLQQAWNHGMMLRPLARSDPAPDTFIATSQMPLANPYRAKPATVRAKLPSTVAPMPIDDERHAAAGEEDAGWSAGSPSQWTMWLERIRPTIDADGDAEDQEARPR